MRSLTVCRNLGHQHTLLVPSSNIHAALSVVSLPVRKLHRSRRSCKSITVSSLNSYDRPDLQAGRAEDLEANSAQLDGQYFGSAHQPHQSVSASPNPGLGSRVGGTATVAGVALLGVTFLIAVVRTVAKARNPKVQRQKTMNKNKLVVTTLDEYLPANRPQLTQKAARQLCSQTGFKPVEIFRKYLWYLLRERKFDQEAADDLVYLKSVLNLSDEQAAEALRERAKRIYDKYGSVMLNTQGMTSAGVERKATARALFSKLLYLSEYEQLIPPFSSAAEKANMREVFGATEDDANRLRIVSLQEVDFDKLEGQFDGED